MVLYVTRDIKTVIDFLQIDKTRPAYVEDMMGVYLRRKPWFEECSNLHYHSQAVDESTAIAGWTSPLDDFSRFLHTMTGRTGALQKMKEKDFSFFVGLTSPTISSLIPILPEITVGSDAIELRVDLLVDPASTDGTPGPEFLKDQIALLRSSSRLPLIFTLRSISQGGLFPDEDVERAIALYGVGLRMGFDFVDLELTSPAAVKDYVLGHRKMCTVIASHHDPKGSLSWANEAVEWKQLFDSARAFGDIVKLIGVANTPDDNDDVKVFKKWAAKTHPNTPLIAINMGEAGKISRVNNGFMTPVSHPALPYKAAPGQLPAADIRRVLGITSQIAPKNFFLFGKPVQHSRSPALQNTLFQVTGLPHSYTLYETDRADEIVHLIRSPLFGGASVTIPMKQDVMPLLDAIDPAAKTIGAVNTIVPSSNADGKTILTGHNTDWQGIVLSLRNASAKASTGEAGVVIGGGGTARAAIYALKNMGYSPIYLVGRNKSKLAALTHAFSADYNIQLIASEEEAKAIQRPPVVAVGTIPGDIPVDAGLEAVLRILFRKGADDEGKVMLEMAYKPVVTPLVEIVREAGWKTVPGLEPLVGQGVHQFRLWTGITPLFGVSRDAVMGGK